MKRWIKDRQRTNKDVLVPEAIVAESGVTLSTTTDGNVNVTKITLASSLIGTVASANLCFGKKLFTFPTGKIDVLRVYSKLAIVAHAGCTKNPELGYGTVLGSGAQATIDAAGATMEDIVDGTATGALKEAVALNIEKTQNGELDIKDGSTTAKAFYLNMAGDWNTNGTITASGEIVVIWSKF